VMIDVGVALAGTGAAQGDRSHGVTGIVVNLMTPETETSTWYHWGMARDFQTGDRGLTCASATDKQQYSLRTWKF
jgi:vanillate O-demethylase monooxygenase subunit